MSFSVKDVPPAAVARVWPKVEAMVERGLRHGEGDTITADHIRAAVLSGKMEMWAVQAPDDDEIVAVIVLRVIQHPKKKRLFIVMLAGRNMDAWADDVELMLQTYRDVIGAHSIDASCRVGLARYLEKRGWNRRSVIMEAP